MFKTPFLGGKWKDKSEAQESGKKDEEKNVNFILIIYFINFIEIFYK